MADSIVRLRIDSNEFDAKLKTASQNLTAYLDKVKKGGGDFNYLDEGVMDCVKAIGQMDTECTSTKVSISELTKAFTEMSMRYKQFTDEEKATPLGKQMKASLDQLKVRIKETKTDLASINQELSSGKFGQFGGVIDNIGHKMGVTGNLTEMLTSKTALLKAGMAAAAVAIYKGAEAWTKYNQELARQDQQTTVITGLKGYDANMMTDRMRALSDTYKVDFRHAVEAANILMSQFGKSGDEAVKLIKDGMQGMILGDGPKLLNMIQQFAPAFVDAGISADKLIAIIHNSEGGLFSEHNMNAILMGIKNIRLMSTQTSNALAKLGIDGQEMSRKMSDGSMTVFDALRKVAGALENAKSGSKEAGEVMQYVFGRQGAMQGMKLARAIAELNLNLEETKRQTGEVGDAYAELQTANEKLAVAIRDCFGYDGWEQMATGIKSSLISALADVVNLLDGLRATWDDLMKKMGKGNVSQNAGAQVGSALDHMPKGISQPIQQANELKNSTNKQELYNRTLTRYNTEIDEKRKQAEIFSNSLVPDIKATGIALKKEIAELEQMRDKYVELATDILNPVKEKKTIIPIKSTDKNTSVTTTQTKTETQELEAAIAKLTEEYQKLATEAKTADDAQQAGISERMTAIKKEIKLHQERVTELKRFAEEAKGIEFKEGSLPALNKQIKEFRDAQSQAASTQEWLQWQAEIDAATRKIALLKGELPKGEQATLTLQVNDEQLKQLRQSGLFSDKSIRVNVEQGKVDLPSIPTDDETIKVNVKQGKVDLPSIPDDNIYILTIAADTTQAMQQVEEMTQEIEHEAPVITPKIQLPTSLETLVQKIQLEIDMESVKVDTQTLETILKDSIKNNINVDSLLDSVNLEIQASIDVPDETWEGIIEKYNELRKEIGKDPIQINLETGTLNNKKDGRDTGLSKSVSEIGKISSGVGSIASGIQQLGIELPEGFKEVMSVVQGMTSILQGISTILLVIQALNQVQATSSIVPFFATGGIAHAANGFVPGNNHTDDIPVMVSSGELILNRAQQGNIASQLEGTNQQQQGSSTPYVSGEQIYLGLTNYLRRSGRGELLTARG